MTEKQATSLTAKESENLPWNCDAFIFVRGRYYASMFSFKIPPHPENPRGGDVTALLWRFAATPSDWVFTWRFRYYRNPGKVWNSGDEKHWFAAKAHGTEEQIRADTEQALVKMTGLAAKCFHAPAPKLQRYEIRGPVEKWFELMSTQPPPWLHTRVHTKHGDGEGAEGKTCCE